MTSTWVVVVGMAKKYYIVSCSMGKDSLALLLKLIELEYPIDIVLFYNTGMEFRAIYDIRDRVRAMCTHYGIRFVELEPEYPFVYCMLEKPVSNRDDSGYHCGYSWCGLGRCRWATRHKLDAIHKFKQSLNGECIDYVGIAADEQDRMEPGAGNKRYPLVEWGMTEADCLHYCRQRGWKWLEETPVTESGWIDLYDILDRVSCWCCANKNLPELYNIYCYLPQYWNQLKYLQSRTNRPMKGWNKTGPKGVFELEKRFALPGAEQKYRRKPVCRKEITTA